MAVIPLVEQVLGLPLVLLVPLTFASSILVVVLLHRLTAVPYPPTIPLIREPPGARRFSLRTRLAYYIDCESLFVEAYEQYLKHGQPVVIPGVGVRKEIIVPPSRLRWLLSQPENQFSNTHGFAEMDQATYSLGDEKPILDPWQGLLVKTDINRMIETICAALDNELGVAFDAHFGMDEHNWKEIDLRLVIARAIAQANSRFTVGLPLCRNPDYLKTLLQQNDLLITVAGALCGMPAPLRPIVGTLASIPNRVLTRRVSGWLIPLWKDRVATARKEAETGVTQTSQEEDHVLMMARYALKERPEEVDDVKLIVRRITALNFGAVHNTSMQVTNLLLNVLGSDPKHNTIARLINESEQILATADSFDEAGRPRWTKTLVSKMKLADSVSRETLRLNPFGYRAMFRKVMVDGLKTEDGHELPKGNVLSYLGFSRQLCGEGYGADPRTYDPFRFSRMRDEAAPVEQGSGEEKKTPVQTFVTTSPDFVPFGHGKHACPGRFLIDFELKMILSYVLRHYHLKFPDSYEGKRPENQWLAEATVPPLNVKICVKRKSQEKRQ
ncbi:cytochrome P450 [Emericellopsis atlantica]|uniref:Cytochrome P450 n=1 Tax=Emericellopsis atlantica TaxID=2614577 RepID=A0A9P7ZN74_9HYPO|nr:cytochrome P450 [Emericellopsis atlantica]KAG9254797.1 cytochrome P450 [Emericellopsis atlantica]